MHHESNLKFYSSPVTSSPSPKTPTSAGSTSGPLFQFTDPALKNRAATVKEQLLTWCQMKTKEYDVRSPNLKQFNCCCLNVIYFFFF